MKKTIGIIGGMGPLATADLFMEITRLTEAGCDQDHIRVCIDSNTNIPDRTLAILHGGVSPVPEMLNSARRLVSIGADLLVLPCNTAHYFYEDIACGVQAPVLHMIEETAKAMQARGVIKAGVLATDGVVQAGVYDRALRARGIMPLYPDSEGQKAVMGGIYNCVKANAIEYDASGFSSAIERLMEEGAQLLILGCTELPIAFRRFHRQEPHINPTTVLAVSAIRAAGGLVRAGMDIF